MPERQSPPGRQVGPRKIDCTRHERLDWPTLCELDLCWRMTTPSCGVLRGRSSFSYSWSIPALKHPWYRTSEPGAGFVPSPTGWSPLLPDDDTRCDTTPPFWHAGRRTPRARCIVVRHERRRRLVDLHHCLCLECPCSPSWVVGATAVPAQHIRFSLVSGASF